MIQSILCKIGSHRWGSLIGDGARAYQECSSCGKQRDFSSPGEAPGGPSRIHGGKVATGIFLGLFGTVVWSTFVFGYQLDQEGQPDPAPDWLFSILLIAPLPLAILLLILRRTRQAAAGLVMGMAIGVVVLAGLCGGLSVINMGA